MSKKKPNTISDAATILSRHLGGGPERRAEIEQMKEDLAVGSQIYEARKAAGLTQTELAERVGTTQSVISDVEAAEYDGHSMPMLRRIAAALNLSVQVRFVPSDDPRSHHAA